MFFLYIRGLSSMFCEWSRCLQREGLQVIPSSYSHPHGTRKETVPPYQKKTKLAEVSQVFTSTAP